jgi:hypothetical protein
VERKECNNRCSITTTAFSALVKQNVVLEHGTEGKINVMGAIKVQNYFLYMMNLVDWLITRKSYNTLQTSNKQVSKLRHYQSAKA